MDVSTLRNKKISVIGAARSGLAVAKLLHSNGAGVFVSDQNAAEKLKAQVSELSSAGIDFEVGGHTDRVYDTSMFVVSPGVPSNAPVVRMALQRKIRVVSELEVASWFCRSPIVAVTGSNGKTTTTTLIGRILGDAKRSHVVAGNIGTAFSSVVPSMNESDIAVLEVSSFQLDHSESFRPTISVILNITEDHMDRYEHSMERYAASKARVFMNQQADDVLIYCADDPWTVKVVPGAKSKRIPFSYTKEVEEGAYAENGVLRVALGGRNTEVLPLDQMTIKGVHNAYNAMAAVIVGQLMNINFASIRATLKNFKGVEHRLEFVRESRGVRYFNDSKATNVDSVRYALEAFKEPIVLILGGRDKGNDYSKLRDLVKKHVRVIVAIGESAATVEAAFRPITTVNRAGSMEDAVKSAAVLAKIGDVVLLSPACSSFDWFDNFEHRGRIFKEIVNKL